MRVALWLRVSTDDQTVENQRRELMRLVELRGFEVVKEYDLTGVSAWQNRLGSRVTQVILDAHKMRFKALVVVSIDRLTRGGVSETLKALHRLADAKVGIVSLREPEIDTTSPFGELVIAILAYFYNLESKRISERTKAGMERARAQGKHIGRPRKRRA